MQRKDDHMGIKDNIRRRLRRFGIEGLTIYILITMGLIWAVDYIFPNVGLWEMLCFDRDRILSGEIWRTITFMVLPPVSGVISALFMFLLYYSIGTELEGYWGSHKFTLYLLSGMILLIIAGFITGDATNYYLYLSLFFVYAILAPNTQFLLFFIIPVKAKYLAAADAVFMGISFILGSWQEKVIIIASLIPLLQTFHKDIFGRIKAKKRYKDFRKKFEDRDK